MKAEGIVENADRVGRDLLGPGLAALADRHRLVGEVRGVGVMWALELVTDHETREPVPAAVMGQVRRELLSRGLLPFLADNRIHVVPPCVVTDDEVARALQIYDEALSAVEAHL
jgi:taurine--2-oxoglutarate transaminase